MKWKKKYLHENYKREKLNLNLTNFGMENSYCTYNTLTKKNEQKIMSWDNNANKREIA